MKEGERELEKQKERKRERGREREKKKKFVKITLEGKRRLIFRKIIEYYFWCIFSSMESNEERRKLQTKNLSINQKRKNGEGRKLQKKEKKERKENERGMKNDQLMISSQIFH